jgi:phosphoglycolate phosphatase
MKNKIIFFDFDGVIVQSSPLIFDITKEFIADIEYSELQKWQEGNIFNQKLRENDDYDEVSHARYYFEQYGKRVKDLAPFKGMEEVFKAIIEMGYLLIIISSSSEGSINDFLVKYDLKKYFGEVLAKETHSGKVEKFKMMLKKYKTEAKNTLMVTDSVGDVKEAMEMKIKTIGVAWGIHDAKKLKEAGADFVAEKPAEIIDGITKLLD